jgi:hypothetical protein
MDLESTRPITCKGPPAGAGTIMQQTPSMKRGASDYIPKIRINAELCETCRWTERPGFVRVLRDAQQVVGCELIPCSDCGGQGIAHCCDGICEQPMIEPPNERQPTNYPRA